MKISELKRFLDNAERTKHTEITFMVDGDAQTEEYDCSSFCINFDDVKENKRCVLYLERVEDN